MKAGAPARRTRRHPGSFLPGWSGCSSAGRITRLAGICILPFATASSGAALDAAERAFTWNEGQALMAAAAGSNDYRRAAQTYQKLVDAGVRNGPLFYNLGTARLQAGQDDRALEALARAELYLGRQPDIRRNMRIAMARKQKTPGVAWPWQRSLLFWHFNLASATRCAIAVAAWNLFWLVLTLRRLGWRRGTGALAILAFLAFVAFGSSAATSAHQELTARGPPPVLPAP